MYHSGRQRWFSSGWQAPVDRQTACEHAVPEVKGFARPAHGSLAQVAVQPPDGVPPLLSVMHVHGSVELRVGRKAQNSFAPEHVPGVQSSRLEQPLPVPEPPDPSPGTKVSGTHFFWHVESSETHL
jgi:hypothetical protein